MLSSIPRPLRSAKTTRYTAAGIAAAGTAAIALTVVPGSADAGSADQSAAAKVQTVPAPFTGQTEHAEVQRKGIAQQLDAVTEQVQAEKKAEKEKAEKKAAEKKAAKKAEAAEKAKKDRKAKKKASRKADRAEIHKKAAKPSYPNNLDGWIRKSLDIMDKHNIPGTYEGIHRNIMRESSGDPRAINDWDINARNGVPSKGLLQVIKPTFDAYHVKGTAWDQYDPVANITAACNYAADRYGTIDNVDSAY